MSERRGVVCYGDEIIRYEIVERPARRTLGIEVYPGGRVVVLAPRGCDDATINERLRLRAAWISRQLATFSQYEHHTAPRQYLSGESHRYLGRQYRLRVKANDPAVYEDQVTLTRGEMWVISPGELPPVKVKELLRCWYLKRAREVFDGVLTDAFDAFQRMGHERPRIVVREMCRRWGSLSPNGQMTLNTRLVQAPRLCVEYVIVHELCHLVHKNHDSAFFALLGQILPDWRARKQRLEQALL
ncbi:MAG: putative metal-dependent hydrolase [Candidatus Ozemobacter sibiricus]|jgi:predicted metal-dependent hydrolase|uniref:Putative metal-dependent hydrolase n=1 Tax=Candidatus Ozemobacter sibiricus TaxID=2268124 RepID=A0A367ZPU2_9BACT|nr:MAG: putative metal-dependent hydrolase [Candidatus Ozemobacter sibiricus]